MSHSQDRPTTQKKNTFFGGAAILLVSSLIVKVIGAIYKIPLAGILTDRAYSDFNSAYLIYTFFLTISTTGLPVALSKMVSEALPLGRRNQVQRTLRAALSAFLVAGIVSFLCMSVLAAPLSKYVLQNEKAVYCVMALSPSVLCVCVIAAFRGYFQGHFNMTPTGTSQIIEAVVKLVVGLALATLFLNLNVQSAEIPDLGERLPAVGAIIGVSVSSVAALIYLIFIYLRHSRRLPASTDRPDPMKEIFAHLMRLAIPITIGSAAGSLISLIDNALVMSQLQKVYQTAYGLGVDAALDAARTLNGIYSKCTSIYNLPASVVSCITVCIIPAVSSALSRKDHREAKAVSESALRIGLLIAMPMGFGLFALGEPIMALVIRNTDTSIAGPLLSLLGLASILVSTQLLCNAILQANGLVNLPILAVVAGGVTKIVVNYILVGNPDIMIYGAPVGTICSFLVIDGLEIFFIHRAIRRPPDILRSAVKPLIASVTMAAAVWAVYGLSANVLHISGNLSTVFAILVGVCVYFVLVLALRAISAQDLSLMPKGDKIAKILKIQ